MRKTHMGVLCVWSCVSGPRFFWFVSLFFSLYSRFVSCGSCCVCLLYASLKAKSGSTPSLVPPRCSKHFTTKCLKFCIIYMFCYCRIYKCFLCPTFLQCCASAAPWICSTWQAIDLLTSTVFPLNDTFFFSFFFSSKKKWRIFLAYGAYMMNQNKKEKWTVNLLEYSIVTYTFFLRCALKNLTECGIFTS